jgi:hypothetical protein
MLPPFIVWQSYCQRCDGRRSPIKMGALDSFFARFLHANRYPLRSKTLLFQPEIAAIYRRTDISNAALALSAMLRPHHAP